jgi:hypothetical protein
MVLGEHVLHAADSPHTTIRSELTANLFNRQPCAGLNIPLSCAMTSCRMRQKTNKRSTKKVLANVRKEMAVPRVALSAQKTVGDVATLSIPHRDSN